MDGRDVDVPETGVGATGAFEDAGVVVVDAYLLGIEGGSATGVTKLADG